MNIWVNEMWQECLGCGKLVHFSDWLEHSQKCELLAKITERALTIEWEQIVADSLYGNRRWDYV